MTERLKALKHNLNPVQRKKKLPVFQCILNTDVLHCPSRRSHRCEQLKISLHLSGQDGVSRPAKKTFQPWWKMSSSKQHGISKKWKAKKQSDIQNIYKKESRTYTKKECLSYSKSSSASHILKLLLSAVLKAPVSLTQKPLHEGYDKVPMTDLVDSTGNHNDTRKEGVGKKLKTAHAALEQGKLRSSGLPARWTSFLHHLYPLADSRAKI